MLGSCVRLLGKQHLPRGLGPHVAGLSDGTSDAEFPQSERILNVRGVISQTTSDVSNGVVGLGWLSIRVYGDLPPGLQAGPALVADNRLICKRAATELRSIGSNRTAEMCH